MYENLKYYTEIRKTRNTIQMYIFQFVIFTEIFFELFKN